MLCVCPFRPYWPFPLSIASYISICRLNTFMCVVYVCVHVGLCMSFSRYICMCVFLCVEVRSNLVSSFLISCLSFRDRVSFEPGAHPFTRLSQQWALGTDQSVSTWHAWLWHELKSSCLHSRHLIDTLLWQSHSNLWLSHSFTLTYFFLYSFNSQWMHMNF